jgi:DNA repair protein RadD
MDSVLSAETMAKHIPNSAYVHGATPKKERLKIVEDFKNGDLQVLLNYGTFTTGFDYPQLSHVIMGRPSNSFALIYQMTGRVVRINLSKIKGVVIDFCGNIEKFGKLEEITIEDFPGYGWGVFNNEKLLTGYPLLSTPIFKKDLNKTKQVVVSDSLGYILDFGKYSGSKLNQIPRSYLEWLILKSGFDFERGKMKVFFEVASKYLEETKLTTLDKL